MTLLPLGQPCCHPPTAAESQRDPGYPGCFAAAGEPCIWATRHDGEADPAFHSERLEAALPRQPHSTQTTDEVFEETVLASGLV